MYLSVISGIPNYLLLFAVSSFLSSFYIASKSILRNAYLIQLPSHFKQKSHVTFTLVSWSDIMETSASLLYIFNSPECYSTQHIEFHVFAGGPYEIQWSGLYDPSPILSLSYQLLLSIFLKSIFPCFHLPLEIPLNISCLGGLLWVSIQLL